MKAYLGNPFVSLSQAPLGLPATWNSRKSLEAKARGMGHDGGPVLSTLQVHSGPLSPGSASGSQVGTRPQLPSP